MEKIKSQDAIGLSFESSVMLSTANIIFDKFYLLER